MGEFGEELIPFQDDFFSSSGIHFKAGLILHTCSIVFKSILDVMFLFFIGYCFYGFFFVFVF